MSGDSGGLEVLEAAVRGGSTMYEAGVRECTSSWNVEEQGTGVFGTVTAAHCDPIDFVDDITGTNPRAPTTLQGTHLGTHGDFEWHTTPELETTRFWADSDDFRDVLSVTQNFARNDFVCVYGRTTGVRICDQVYRTDANINSKHHQVIMDEHTTDGGDSGGGWSFVNEAAGVHTGSVDFDGATRSQFSKAKRLDNALNVEVRITP
jgi:hypothetical protein